MPIKGCKPNTTPTLTFHLNTAHKMARQVQGIIYNGAFVVGVNLGASTVDNKETLKLLSCDGHITQINIEISNLSHR